MVIFNVIFLLNVFYCLPAVNSEALKITGDNYEATLRDHKVVLINFYADWCMFSARLAPIFHQAADAIHGSHPGVKLARVDCEVETDIAKQNGINKFPTVKLYRNGKPLRREYRGERSVQGFTEYINLQTKPAAVEVLDPKDLKVDADKNTLIGYFKTKGDDAFKTLEKVCDDVYETIDCFACIGEEAFKSDLEGGEKVVLRQKASHNEPETKYDGSLTGIDDLLKWAKDKANPLVREITFANAEDLTEEGLPFLILFHRKDETESTKRYVEGIKRELLPEREKLNFLTADGAMFSHPLHHMGKSMDDLPVIAIDSFRHIYIFKKFDNVDVPGKLKQFAEDLHSGKLHQDFHNPPPEHIEEHVQEIPKTPKSNEPQPPELPKVVAEGVIREPVIEDKPEEEEDKESVDDTVKPPETVFQKLAPSDNRYTLLHMRDYSGNYRDEL